MFNWFRITVHANTFFRGNRNLPEWLGERAGITASYCYLQVYVSEDSNVHNLLSHCWDVWKGSNSLDSIRRYAQNLHNSENIIEGGNSVTPINPQKKDNRVINERRWQTSTLSSSIQRPLTKPLLRTHSILLNHHHQKECKERTNPKKLKPGWRFTINSNCKRHDG